MEKIITIFSFLICTIALNAQQINSCSGNAEFEEYSAEWIIGGSLIDNSVFMENTENPLYSIEHSNGNLIELNPTLARDFLIITSKLAFRTNIEYKITDISGNSLMIGSFDYKTSLELDIKGFAPGIYYVIFSSPKDKSFIVSKKFVKL